MITDAFNHSGCARIPDGKPFAGHAVDVQFAGRSSVQRHIATSDVAVGNCIGFRRCLDDDLGTAQPFAGVIVALTGEVEGEAAGGKSGKALPGRSCT